MRFFDPRSEPTTPIEPYRIEHRPAGSDMTVGLLANGFPDSVAFLDALEQALTENWTAPGDLRVRRYAKPNASAPMSTELATAVIAECDALVTAYGH